jgi:hypothetical protein
LVPMSMAWLLPLVGHFQQMIRLMYAKAPVNEKNQKLLVTGTAFR